MYVVDDARQADTSPRVHTMFTQTNSNAPFPTVEELAEVMAQDARRRGFSVEHCPAVRVCADGVWVCSVATIGEVTVVSRSYGRASVRGGK